MFTHLFSQSYQHGLLPDSWTRSTVCPIFKKGNRSLPENYRPISLTAIPCKLFEHIIVSKIWDHLNKHNIITNKQHGFRKGMSCETQLIEALHDWEIVWRIRSDIIGKREDFRRVDEYCFSIIYYINLLCTFVEKSF